MSYYGGASGRRLVLIPGKGYVTQDDFVKDEKPEEEEENPGQGDGVAIQPPPAGASVAEARPVGLSIAGVGGVAASKPVATAVVGPSGLAISRPVATAIAGVPVGEIVNRPGGPGGPGGPAQQQDASPVLVAVGPSRQNGGKYTLQQAGSRTLPPGTVLLFPAPVYY